MVLRVREAPALILFAWLISPRAAAEDWPGFSSTIQGISLRPEIGTGIYGYEVTGNLGGTSFGARSLGANRYLLQWEAHAELVEGAVAFEHPFYDLFGARVWGRGEGSLRLMPQRDVSPILEVGLGGNASAVTRAGEPFNGGTHFNSLDGLGGVVGNLHLDAGAGASLLDEARSVVLAAQFVAEIASPLANTPSLVFFGGALHGRFDLKDSLVVLGEASFAVTPSSRNVALQTSTHYDRWSLSATAVKTIGTGLSLGLGLAVSRVGSSTAYQNGDAYSAAAPIDARIWILGEYSL